METMLKCTISIQLTPAGKKAYERYWAQKGIPNKPLQQDPGSEYWHLLSLWEFLEICGPATKNKRCPYFTRISTDVDVADIKRK